MNKTQVIPIIRFISVIKSLTLSFDFVNITTINLAPSWLTGLINYHHFSICFGRLIWKSIVDQPLGVGGGPIVCGQDAKNASSCHLTNQVFASRVNWSLLFSCVFGLLERPSPRLRLWLFTTRASRVAALCLPLVCHLTWHDFPFTNRNNNKRKSPLYFTMITGFLTMWRVR